LSFWLYALGGQLAAIERQKGEKMDIAIQSLYQNLLREAQKYRVPISVLARFPKKIQKVECGKADFSEVIVPLIREVEKSILRNAREGDRELALASMRRKRDRFCELQKEKIYDYRGK